jgi:putative membrane protein
MTAANPHSGPEIPRQKLHPLTPVLKGFRLLVAAVAYLSWRSLEQLHFARWLAVVGGLLVVILVYSYIAWTVTGYEVIGRELRIHEGLVSRRVRTVPLERLQAIEVIQPFQARIFGLAELKLDVAGSEKSEAPLSFLPIAQAQALRTQLLALSAGVEPEQLLAPPEESLLFQVDNHDVGWSQFLTPPVMFTPLAILYVVGQFLFNEDLGVFAILSSLSALGATLLAPAMRVANFWDFRLARTEDGKLRIQHGRLTTRSQTVPVKRIQALTVTWPLLWRSKGWLRITLAVAGQSSVGEGTRRAEVDRLLPVATLEEARSVMPYVMPGVDLAGLPMTPVPRSARWLAPFRARVLVAGLTEQVFASVDGFATRTLTIVPYGRIQSVRLTQGPWQRRLGLATVHADIAGGAPVSAAHRPLEEARTWAAELSVRAHRARANA